MQESLYNTVQRAKLDQKVNIEELEMVLNSDIEEVVSLCKKACLKPKTDDMGNAYFTKGDIDILKKVKELYSQSNSIQNKNIQNEELDNPSKKINFLQKAKQRLKNDAVVPIPQTSFVLKDTMQKMEDNLINKFSAILSEKMDGFDEIVVELVRSKTENEKLRQQVNSLNQQIYIMKKELSSYMPLPFGFYSKKNIEE